MTAESFRKAALALEGVVESAHMNHPDFRVGGRIFATLGYPEAGWGMVHVPLEEQARLLEAAPEAYVSKGAWGKQGCTLVHLAKAQSKVVTHALELAWQHAQTKKAPRKKTPARRVTRSG